MSTNDAQQLAFDGMAPRKRRKRAPAEKIVAAEDPIAQVVLDVQATHLGQTSTISWRSGGRRPHGPASWCGSGSGAGSSTA